MENLSGKELYSVALIFKLAGNNGDYIVNLIAAANKQYKEAIDIIFDDVHTDMYEKIIKVGDRQNYQMIIDYLIESIGDKQNIFSIIFMAKIYEIGLAGDINYVEAVALYEIAVEAGNIQAMVYLARMYVRGSGVKQDYQKAIKLYEVAVESGNVYAANHLALMYKNGFGVAINHEKVLEMYEIGVTVGDIDSIIGAALIHNDNNKNYEKAIELYEIGIAKGSGKSCFLLATLYIEHMGYAYYGKAKELLKKALVTEVWEAYNNLSVIYKRGLAVDKNLAKAKKLLKLGVKKNVYMAFYNLALDYLDEKKYDKARKLLEIAVEHNISPAYTVLADMYYRALGVERDYDKVIEIYKLGYEKNKVCLDLIVAFYITTTYKRDYDAVAKYFCEIDQVEKLRDIYGYSEYVVGVIKRQYDLEKKVAELNEVIIELKTENNDLKTHIENSPDGELYFEAKKQWDYLKTL